MSKLSSVDIECPKCAVASTYEFYTSVNVTVDPNLKDMVLDGSIFYKSCPKCGTRFDVSPDMLYHDMRKRLMIWLKNPDESGVPNLEEGTDAALTQLLPGYAARIVTGRNELIEKIKIADDSHSDIMIEIAKLFYSINNQIDLAAMFYYQQTKKKIFGRQKLVFVELQGDSGSKEHAVDLANVYESAQPFVPRVESAIAKKWGPFMLVTRVTTLQALQDCGLARML
jgi:hypothetical protein